MHYSFKFVLLASFLTFHAGCASKVTLLSNAGHLVDNSTNKVTSWKELNEKNVVMQHYDYSCGAASLATLIKYYFDADVSENKILDYVKSLFGNQEYEKVKKAGLSLLELEKISGWMGYQSASVRLKPSALQQLSGPVIVFLKTKYYKHFVVLRGVREDRVFLADPSRGNIQLPIQEFIQEWQGETFVLGKKGFGTPDKHALAVLYHTKYRNELELLKQSLKYQPLRRLPR